MYYEERLIDGVMYVRYTPDGKWIEKSKTGYQPKHSKVYSVDLAYVGDSREVCGTCGGADFGHYGFCPKCDTDAYSY